LQAFQRVCGKAISMPAANVDTDVIMPKQFLKGIDREGLSRGVFHNLRYDESGAPRADYLLNQRDYEHPTFLVVGANFGCGSSREHAVWGLLQFGVRAIIGTTFGGIFADNAQNNGLLLVTQPASDIAAIAALVQPRPAEMAVDLEAQTVQVAGRTWPFAIEPNSKRSLLLGLDRIGETLTHAERIRAFESAYFAAHPWTRLER
jgi:3-isopropylmalate/(R)-2-methylmalate dehydratase small subunit